MPNGIFGTHPDRAVDDLLGGVTTDAEMGMDLRKTPWDRIRRVRPRSSTSHRTHVMASPDAGSSSTSNWVHPPMPNSSISIGRTRVAASISGGPSMTTAWPATRTHRPWSRLPPANSCLHWRWVTKEANRLAQFDNAPPACLESLRELC